jgi:predicted AAA+ superfamily ATPase
MTLEKYLGDREIWQNNTIEEIKKKVIYKPTSLKNNRRGEKLVAIYGPPQIGKTTLILCLLGIAPEYL